MGLNMIEESGPFKYEKNGIIIEESVLYKSHLGGTMKILLPNDNGKYWKEIVYIPERNEWMWPDPKSDDPDVFEKFPYKVIKFEYTSRWTDGPFEEDK